MKLFTNCDLSEKSQKLLQNYRAFKNFDLLLENQANRIKVQQPCYHYLKIRKQRLRTIQKYCEDVLKFFENFGTFDKFVQKVLTLVDSNENIFSNKILIPTDQFLDNFIFFADSSGSNYQAP